MLNFLFIDTSWWSTAKSTVSRTRAKLLHPPARPNRLTFQLVRQRGIAHALMPRRGHAGFAGLGLLRSRVRDSAIAPVWSTARSRWESDVLFTSGENPPLVRTLQVLTANASLQLASMQRRPFGKGFSRFQKRFGSVKEMLCENIPIIARFISQAN